MKFIIFILALAIVIAGCAQAPLKQQQPISPNPQTYVVPTAKGVVPPTVPATAEVRVSGMKFIPETLSVGKGTTVTWTNEDSVAHTVTFDSIAVDLRLPTGSQVSYTFADSGTFSYSCTIHPSMRGIVIVQ